MNNFNMRRTLRTGHGGEVPGKGKGDKIPAKYEPGEFVVSNDMLKAQPGLAQHLHDLRGNVMARKGQTNKQHGKTLHAATGIDPLDPQSRVTNPSLAPTAPNTLQPEAASANRLRLLTEQAKEVRLAAAATPAGPTTSLGAASPNNGIRWTPNIPDPIHATTSLGAAPPAPPPVAPAVTPTAAAAPTVEPAPQPNRVQNLRASVNQLGTSAGEAYKYATTGQSPGSAPIPPKPAFVPNHLAPDAGRVSKLTNAATNLAGRAASAMPTAAGAARGVLGAAAPAAAVYGAYEAGKNVYDVAASRHSTGQDIAVQGGEEAAKMSLGGLGAAAGGSLGLMGGPLAPVTVPLGAAAGGLAGYFGGEKAIHKLRGLFGADEASPLERMQAKDATEKAAKDAAAQKSKPTLRAEPLPAPIYSDQSVERPAAARPAAAKPAAQAAPDPAITQAREREAARINEWHAAGDRAREASFQNHMSALRGDDDMPTDPATGQKVLAYAGLAGKKKREAQQIDLAAKAKSDQLAAATHAESNKTALRGQDQLAQTAREGHAVTLRGDEMRLEASMAPTRLAQAQALQFQKVMQAAGKTGQDPVVLATQSGVNIDVIKRIQEHQGTQQTNGDARAKSMAAPFDGKFNDEVDGKSVVDKESEGRATEIFREMTEGQNLTPDQIAQHTNNVINQVKLIKAMRDSQLRENTSFPNMIGKRRDKSLPSDIPGEDDLGGQSQAGTVGFWDGMFSGHGVTAGDHTIGGYQLRAGTDDAAIKYWNEVAAQRAAKKAKLRTN